MSKLPEQGSERLLATLLKADKQAVRSIEAIEATSAQLRSIAMILRANVAARLPRYSPVEP